MVAKLAPSCKWWYGLPPDEFSRGCRDWEAKLRDIIDELEFPYKLFIPRVPGLVYTRKVKNDFFCGEAVFLEEYSEGEILAFFWTGSKIHCHAFYTLIPHQFIIIDKKKSREFPLSIKRRS